jgi:FkbM family methyltransferase
MTSVVARYGAMEIIESDSIVSASLRIYGEWAQNELELLARFIAPGACVLDVGAFIGTHTLAFARMTGDTGRVYAFEPRREIFAYLQRNIEANGLGQVTACNVALGMQPAELEMDRLDLEHADNFGGLSLPSPGEAGGQARYFVSVVTLDAQNLPKVDVVKLDVEGMEGEVLAGARGVITRDRPVVFAECNALDGGASLLEFARANGYRVFGSVSAAYNAANFNAVAENIFGAAKELGLVLIPAERLTTYQTVVEQARLPEVERLDDLSCLLLSKPQYYDEVLAPFCTEHEVQLTLVSPELAAAQAATGRCEEALSEAKALAFARLDEISALTARVQVESTALGEAQRLAFERLDEIAALTARFEAGQQELQLVRQELQSVRQELQLVKQALLVLEQSTIVRALRKVNLLKSKT